MINVSNPFHRETDFFPELTSLIDVMFLLLIFFMLTTTFEKEKKIEALHIELPKSLYTTPITEDKAITIFVDQQGIYTLDDKPCNYSALRDVLGIKLVNSIDSVIIIYASKDTPFQNIVNLYDVFQTLGVRKFSFMVE